MAFRLIWFISFCLLNILLRDCIVGMLLFSEGWRVMIDHDNNLTTCNLKTWIFFPANKNKNKSLVVLPEAVQLSKKPWILKHLMGFDIPSNYVNYAINKLLISSSQNVTNFTLNFNTKDIIYRFEVICKTREK